MSVAEYFSADYASGRERFRAAATRAAAGMTGYLLPDHHGPGGETLTLDVAHFGGAEAQSALVVIAGTHGVEGLAGSGCLVGLLEDRLHEELQASNCLLLLHAINPYGFAWLRRVTEDGVDLNRNFVDFSRPLPPSESYERLHEWLVPREWQGDVRRAADEALMAYAQQHGMAALQAAVSGGQYTRPGGLFYGGIRESWSARMLLRVLREILPASVRRVVMLDLHTGLGPPAYGEPILDAGDGTVRERALRWFGADVRDLSAGESVSARLTGTLARGIERARPDL
ncbi:MAG: DUF2817 domain-containing protein, partial [Steroidobacteraceae bacterium]